MRRPTVLVTREKVQPLASLLHALGCDAVHWPVSELVATQAPAPEGPTPEACLVTSAAAARFLPPSQWPQVPVIAVGEATALAIRRAGGTVQQVAEGSGEAALARLPATGPVWFIGAARPAPAVLGALASGRLVHWPVYDRVDRADAPGPGELEGLGAVTLASPSAARVWCTLASARDAPLVVMGETTAAAVRNLGRTPAAVALRPTLEDLAEAAAHVSHKLRG